MRTAFATLWKPIEPSRSAFHAEDPVLGILEGNSLHEQALEAARKVPAKTFLMNVVQNAHKEIVRVLAGDIGAAWEAGVETARPIFEVEVEEVPDIVVTSPGGYPRDIDLYQAQKAVAPAERLVRPGGTIILVGECRQGFGQGVYVEWLREAPSLEEAARRFRVEGYSEGSSKAWMLARAMRHACLVLVSSQLSKGDIAGMFMEHRESAQRALEAALDRHGPDARVAVLPTASTVVPVPKVSTGAAAPVVGRGAAQ